MSDLTERIKKRIEARRWKFATDTRPYEGECMQWANRMNTWCLEIIDEEAAKEPQENEESYQHTIYLLNQEVQRLIELLAQEQPIVRSAEEVAELMKNGLLCDFCPLLGSCKRDRPTCYDGLIDWLTKKEVK